MNTSSTGPVEGPASFAIDGQIVHGTVMAADPDLGTFLFVTGEADADDHEPEPVLPEQGQSVRIRWGSLTGFQAEAKVLEVEDQDRWILSVPVEIDPGRLRQSARVLGEGAWTFLLGDGSSVEVYDLSERGLGLSFPSGEGPRGRGATLQGSLRAEGAGIWQVTLTCTNVRSHPHDDGYWIVGGRLECKSAEDRSELAELVSRLR